MSRRLAALKPQLNRIRAWAYEGSTDAWIAHQLDTTAEAVRAFRQEHGIERGGPAPLAPITPDSVVEAMLAEEAAAEAGEITLEPTPESPEPETAVESAPARAPRRRARERPAAAAAEAAPEPEAPAEDAPVAEENAPADPPARSSSRRRGGRSGSSRQAPAAQPEATAEAEGDPSDDGSEPAADDEPGQAQRKRRRRGRGRGRSRALEARLLPGSVLLLDTSVTADATFQEHWQDAGFLRVEVGPDAIVLRRAADAEADRSER